MKLDVQFRSGVPIYEQVLYAVKRAIALGQLKPGDRFYSVHQLSRDLKINPNTSHKIITHLVAQGILEVISGIGTRVTGVAKELASGREKNLEYEIEKIVVEAKNLSWDWTDLERAVHKRWLEFGRTKQ